MCAILRHTHTHTHTPQSYCMKPYFYLSSPPLSFPLILPLSHPTSLPLSYPPSVSPSSLLLPLFILSSLSLTLPPSYPPSISSSLPSSLLLHSVDPLNRRPTLYNNYVCGECLEERNIALPSSLSPSLPPSHPLFLPPSHPPSLSLTLPPSLPLPPSLLPSPLPPPSPPHYSCVASTLSTAGLHCMWRVSGGEISSTRKKSNQLLGHNGHTHIARQLIVPTLYLL